MGTTNIAGRCTDRSPTGDACGVCIGCRADLVTLMLANAPGAGHWVYSTNEQTDTVHLVRFNDLYSTDGSALKTLCGSTHRVTPAVMRQLRVSWRATCQRVARRWPV